MKNRRAETILARSAVLIGCLLLRSAAAADGPVSDLRKDEEIVFVPAAAHQVSGGSEWECEIRGCVYEPEKRRLALGLLRQMLDFKNVEMTASEAVIFNERARLFMVDHERGRTVVARVGSRPHAVGTSGPDGWFSRTVRLSEREVPEPAGVSPQIQAVLRAGDPRRFCGSLNLWKASGITVISDIDDTIKVTQVRNRQTLLRKTFLEPFQPVPGMSDVYRAWAKQSRAQFAYVSASPWQLFLPLSEFNRSNGFPPGPFYLKKFRWKDESFLSLFENPERYKPAVIEPLLNQFPRRQFVFVGDSGERDPEIYADLARRYPQQVARILIRDVTDESASAPRYQQAFRGLPPSAWRIFRAPPEIRDCCPPGGVEEAPADGSG